MEKSWGREFIGWRESWRGGKGRLVAAALLIISVQCTYHDYPALLQTLQNIVDETHTPRSIEASGILAGVKRFQFIISIVVYKKVFSITANLSEMLQAESLDYGSAASLIKAAIATFCTLRSNDQWELLWEEAKALATHVGCLVEEPTRSTRARKATRQALDDYIITADTTGSSHIAKLRF